MGLNKNLGGDGRVKEPYWGPFTMAYICGQE